MQRNRIAALFQAKLAPAAKKAVASVLATAPLRDSTSLLQASQQGVVRGGAGDTLDQPFHRRLRRHLTQAASQRVHAIELLGAEKLLLAPRPARTDIDRRIDPLLGQRTIELDLAVSGALELLEDHVVHS